MRMIAGLAALALLAGCAGQDPAGGPGTLRIGTPLPQAAYAGEDTDFGVAPVSVPHSPVHSPTPTTIPGARVITTAEMNRSVAARDSALIYVLSQPSSAIPGSLFMSGAGQVSPDEPAMAARLGTVLETAGIADRSAPVTFYCANSECWLSYNAALRAVALGYTSVRWYRGGIDSWSAAGLPLVGVPVDRW